jgi:hypothetical protein
MDDRTWIPAVATRRRPKLAKGLPTALGPPDAKGAPPLLLTAFGRPFSFGGELRQECEVIISARIHHETKELLISSVAILLFGVALVVWPKASCYLNTTFAISASLLPIDPLHVIGI